MKGAGIFSDIFKTGIHRHKKLYIEFGRHARGYTLEIWILDKSNAEFTSIHCYEGAVKVYGVVSGNPGWTESYGWLHDGPWVADFQRLVARLRRDRRKRDLQTAKEIAAKESLKKKTAEEILANY